MPRVITIGELDRAASGTQVVEVLPHDEFEWAHLPGAINVPLRQLDTNVAELDRQRPVIVYCHDGL